MRPWRTYSLATVTLACLVSGETAHAEASAAEEASLEASTDAGRSGSTLIQSTSSAAASASSLSKLYNRLTTRPLDKTDSGQTIPPAVLLLEATVNGEVLSDVVTAEITAAGELLLSDSFWASARMRHPEKANRLSTGEEAYRLSAVPGLTYALDVATLKLDIDAPVEAFMRTSSAMKHRAGKLLPPHSPPGGYLNYNISVTRSSDGSLIYGGLFDSVLFNGWGSLVNRMVMSGQNRGGSLKTIRAETYWQKDLPGRMEKIIVGDTISSDGGWSRPVRFGGIRYGRDFGLQPTFISFPLPGISGSAALPSTIDVLVNNSKQQTGLKVSPGAFDITGVPIVTGSGQINLVVTDLRGVQTLLTRDYYASARLLAAGLSDFSFEAGALREDFGLSSNSYGAGFLAASWRHGITPGLTLQSRFEAQQKRQAIGSEAVLNVANIALARGAVSWATGHLTPNSRVDSGWHYLFSLERASREGSFSAEWEHYDIGFEQFGNYAFFGKPRDRLRVGASTALLPGVSLGASYIDQKSWEQERFRTLSGTLGTQLPLGIALSAYAAGQLSGKRGWSFGLNLTKALGGERTASASVSRSNDGSYAKYVALNQSVPVGPGLGWRIDAIDNYTQALRAGVTLNTTFAQLSAVADIQKSFNAIRVGASGAIGWMKGLTFASREINGQSFAVVKVGDLPGVKVYRANFYAAKTNSKGLAFVSGLLPYQDNKLSVEAGELPFNVKISGIEEYGTPYARAGIFVNFPITRSINALITLHDRTGQPLPHGTTVRINGAEDFVVGRRGQAYLTDLSSSNTLEITWERGSCKVRIAIDPKANEEANIGPIVCGGTP